MLNVTRILFKQSRLISILLVVISMIFAGLVLNVVMNVKQANLEVRSTKNFKGKNVFIVSDSLHNEREKEFFRESNSLNTLNKFAHELRNNSSWEYYNPIWQPIEVADFEGDPHFDAFYEAGITEPAYNVNGMSYSNLKSVQFNQKVFELNNLQFQDGKGFVTEDFRFDKAKGQIPVILGADYTGIYVPGDTLDILYYDHRLQGVVTGILAPSQKVLTKIEPELPLDAYMILPLMSFDDAVLNSSGLFFRASLLSQIGGMMITDLNALELRQELATISGTANFYDFDIIGASGIAINALVAMTETNRGILIGYAAIIGFITLFLFLWAITNVIKKNTEVYKVFLISGASMSQLYRATRNRFVLCLLISLIIPVGSIFILINNPLEIVPIYLLTILPIFVLIVCMSGWFIKRTFQRFDLVQQLKG
ncbi:hypothetical protein D3C74_26450 [compost metagenome]